MAPSPPLTTAVNGVSALSNVAMTDPTRSVYVSGMSPAVTADQLRQFFSTVGTVTNIKILTTPRYYAFVEFQEPEQAESALYLTSSSNHPAMASWKIEKPRNANATIIAQSKAAVASSVSSLSSVASQQSSSPPSISMDGSAGSSYMDNVISRTVYCSSLDSQLPESQVIEFFGKIGTITNYKICGDAAQSKRFGFFEYATAAQAAEALRSLHSSLLGRFMIRLAPSKSAITIPSQQKSSSSSLQSFSSTSGTSSSSNNSIAQPAAPPVVLLPTPAAAPLPINSISSGSTTSTSTAATAIPSSSGSTSSSNSSAVVAPVASTTVSALEQQQLIQRTVYVGNIDKKLKDEDIRLFFERACGQPVKFALAGDKQPARFCFIEYADIAQRDRALALNGTLLGSLPLRVSPSKTPILGPGQTSLTQAMLQSSSSSGSNRGMDAWSSVIESRSSNSSTVDRGRPAATASRRSAEEPSQTGYRSSLSSSSQEMSRKRSRPNSPDSQSSQPSEYYSYSSSSSKRFRSYDGQSIERSYGSQDAYATDPFHHGECAFDREMGIDSQSVILEDDEDDEEELLAVEASVY